MNYLLISIGLGWVAASCGIASALGRFLAEVDRGRIR